MLAMYFLAFCRVTIGLTFVLAGGRKALAFEEFQQTLRRFRLLPQALLLPVALLFIAGELLVTLLMICGGWLLLAGFALAALLLLVFSGALLSVILRGISTACHCFGPGRRPVSRADLWRNLGFLLCALGGFAGAAWDPQAGAPLNSADWAFTGLSATGFVLIWTQLDEFGQLFADN
jgi:hypothetical protein